VSKTCCVGFSADPPDWSAPTSSREVSTCLPSSTSFPTIFPWICGSMSTGWVGQLERAGRERLGHLWRSKR
jgi:hypothetical protein